MVSTSHIMTTIDKKKKADLMALKGIHFWLTCFNGYRIKEHEYRIKEHDRRIQKLTKIDEIASQMKP